jgi:hypothetical protein
VGGARDSWTAHAGLEWDGLSIGGRPLPIRLGGRTGVLPFGWEPDASAEGATERAATGGLGLVMAGGAVRPDVVAEFGSRSDGTGIDETFWRLGFSIRVLGR